MRIAVLFIKPREASFPLLFFPSLKAIIECSRRNLIYTAITRSKQFLILCGEEEALRIGVERADDQARNTTLTEKLQQAMGKLDDKANGNMVEASIDIEDTNAVASGDQANIMTAEISFEEALLKVDPLIGMNGVTPYDFLTTE